MQEKKRKEKSKNKRKHKISKSTKKEDSTKEKDIMKKRRSENNIEIINLQNLKSLDVEENIDEDLKYIKEEIDDNEMLEFEDKNLKEQLMEKCEENLNKNPNKDNFLKNFVNKNNYIYKNELDYENSNNPQEKDKLISNLEENKNISFKSKNDLKFEKDKSNINSNIIKKNMGKISKFLLIYDIEKSANNKEINWPINILFGSRKYYMMTKKKDLNKKSTNIINYYCVKHHYYSHIKKDCKICNSHLQYKRDEDEFYLIEDRSAECQKNIIPNKKILEENSKKVYKLSNLRNELIKY